MEYSEEELKNNEKTINKLMKKGFILVPTPDDELATITFFSVITNSYIKCDGWDLLNNPTKVAIESTDDYTDEKFHPMDGKTLYRLVYINEKGNLEQYGYEVFNSLNAIKIYTYKNPTIDVIDYNTILNLTLNNKNEKSVTVEQGGNKMEEKQQDFVTVTILKTQVLGSFTSQNNGIEYSRILTSDGYTFIRPTNTLKESAYDEGKLYFSIPEDFKIGLERSYKIDGQSDADGKPVYKTEKIEVTAQELRDKVKYHKNPNPESKDSDWVVIRVTKGQIVRNFEAKTDEGTVNLSCILTPDGETYIRPSEQIREVKGNSNLREFSLHKNQQIRLTKTNFDNIIEKNEETGKNIFETSQREVTAQELFDIHNNRQLNKGNVNNESKPDIVENINKGKSR
ncbi:MAG: hypothetical protein K2M73_07780 [Lachnospiraceae bacterium]|nr:hypothetical protein [Lachnospiraceae bacterium]